MANLSAPFVPSTHKVRALITSGDSEVTLDLRRFQSNWGINMIPTASCLVSTGVDLAEPARLSGIHTLQGLEILNSDLPVSVKVYKESRGYSPDNELWNTEPTLIFDGSVIGIGYNYSMGSYNVELRLAHWIADLDETPAINSLSHPSNSAQFSWVGVRPIFEYGTSTYATTQATDQGVALLFQAVADQFVSLANIQKDLWGKTLLPWMKWIADASQEATYSGLSRCFETDTFTADNQTVAALNRFKTADSEGYSPLALDAATPELAGSIAQYLSNTTNSSFIGTTLWQKLLRWASDFRFCVIPGVSEAAVVPYSPAYREVYEKSITANQQLRPYTNTTKIRPTRGVYLLVPDDLAPPSYTSAAQNPGVLGTFGSGGCYAPENPPSQGTIKFVSVPAWMSEVPSQTSTPSVSLNNTGTQEKPVESTTETRGDGQGSNITSAAESVVPIYDSLAQEQYLSEVLRGTNQTIQGPFRLDISPGSIVNVRGADFIPKIDDALSQQNYVGYVQKLSCIFDATGSSPKAITSFYLSHIRTELANEQGSASMESHPLYPSATWSGGALVADA